MEQTDAPQQAAVEPGELFLDPGPGQIGDRLLRRGDRDTKAGDA
ncbi:hypothetical protein [Streptomyces sp. SBT349]|nr:hypothetical protein [Streptomyces sp. SBT349]